MALDQPDPDVLRLARRGDERAFALIVRQYQTPLFNYVARVLGGDRSLAEDLCQEVFLRVYQALPGFDNRCRFTTWLFQVAKHRVVDELRARERRGRAAGRPRVRPAPVAGGGADRVGRGDGRRLARDRRRSTLDLKMALVLRDVVGLSYAEIADALETTLATVKWRIYKAREIVAAELARRGLRPRAPTAPRRLNRR